jgi:uncharacterized membrane protein YgaE (UPF0421/DUF939 family)
VEELKDIKGIIEVPDYSLWILLSIIIGVIFSLVLIIYFFRKRKRRRKKLTLEQTAMKNLKEINFENTKNAVYTFSEDFQYFINDKNKESFENLQKELEIYKYKKQIDQLSEELKTSMKTLIREIK